MKNRMQLYSKSIVLPVIVGVMLCFASAVWATPKPQQSKESKPVVMTKTAATDVWIDEFKVHNKSRSGQDIYEGDDLLMRGDSLICGCHNRLVWVKFEADGQFIWEGYAGFTQQYPSEPVCYLTSVCPEEFVHFGHNAHWKAFPGTHTLKFTVDSKSEISEINENNNSKSVTVTVKRRLLPLPETKPKTPINIPVPNSPAGGQLR